jgi:hypothetical protein
MAEMHVSVMALACSVLAVFLASVLAVFLAQLKR